MTGEIVRGSEGAVRVSRTSRDGERGRWVDMLGGVGVGGPLTICLDVKEKTVDGFNYG